MRSKFNPNISFVAAVSRSSTANDLSKAFALVKEFPFRTSREISAKIGADVISHDSLHKRLPELRNKGFVKNVAMRVCTVTGKKAHTWAPINAL